MNSSVFRRDLNVPKVLADLVDSDREFQTVGAATANDRSAKAVTCDVYSSWPVVLRLDASLTDCVLSVLVLMSMTAIAMSEKLSSMFY